MKHLKTLPALCLIAGLVVLAGVLLGLTHQADPDRVVIKMGHGLDTFHPVHRAMLYMAERLEEKSGGTMTIDVYPSEQLGNERQLVELLQIGSLGMTKVSAAVMEGFAPVYSLLSVPYLFRDIEHSYEVLDGEIGRELLLSSEPFWLRGLCFYDAGSRSFYTKDKPILHPDDLAGLKIRVQESPSAQRMVSVLGGSPTPIAWGELYTALQQGVVDGAENNPPSFYTSQHYKIAPHYSLDEHTAVPDVVLISTTIWESLTPQQQQWLQEAADESAVYQRRLWKEASDEALREVQAAGVTVYHPDKAPFVEKVQPIYDDYRDSDDPVDQQIYRYIQAIQSMPASEVGVATESTPMQP
ncbi:C4-dicarboxylate ABC transporter substrate-binding protein [Rhodothermaceae bacterium RA]|nr:C4-dicarboxylate ABC transporter substrate-binding protein [Rhodothermaceae bacterium RA]